MATTIAGINLVAPASDPAILPNGSFTMTLQLTTSGGGGWGDTGEIHWQWDQGIDSWTDLASTGDLNIAAQTNPLEGVQDANEHSLTVYNDGTEGTFAVRGRVIDEDTDEFFTSEQTVTVSLKEYTATGDLTPAGDPARLIETARTTLESGLSFAGAYRYYRDYEIADESGEAITDESGEAIWDESGPSEGIYTGSADGDLTPAGAFTRLLNTSRTTISSALSFAGDFTRNLVTTRSTIESALSFAGAFTRLLNTARTTISSGIDFAGAYQYVVSQGQQLYEESRDGALSLAATFTYLLQALRTYSSGISFAGAVSRLLQTTRTAIESGISFAGDFTRSLITNRTAISSGLSFAGDLTKLINTISQSVSGGLSAAGDYLRYLVLARLKDGALSTAGAIYRKIATARTTIESGISFSGAYDYIEGFGQSFYNRTVQGVLSFAQTLGQTFHTRTLSGLVDFSSRVWRERPLYGFVYRTISAFRSASGALSATGQVISEQGQYYARTVTGILSTAGIAITTEFYPSLRSGVISAAGTLRRLGNFLRTKTATLTPTGKIKRKLSLVLRLYDGALSFAGSISRTFYKIYDGALSFAGEITTTIFTRYRTYTGALSSAGDYIRYLVAERLFFSNLSFSGAVEYVTGTTQLFYNRTKTGVLDLSGSLSRIFESATGRTASGILNIYGRITIIDAVITRLTAASITPAGSFIRKLVTNRSKRQGTLANQGNVSNVYSLRRTLSAGVDLAGGMTYDVSNFRYYTALGTVDFSGDFSATLHEFYRTKSGALTPQATIDRLIEVARAQSGGVSFAGAQTNIVTPSDWQQGYLSFSGAYSRKIANERITQESDLTFSGGVTHALVLTRTKTGQLIITVELSKSREKLYLGPPNY